MGRAVARIKQQKTSDGYWEPVYDDQTYAHSRVYFIRQVGTDLVKVGFSDDIKRRLRELQAATAHELELDAAIIGTKAIEVEIHRRLKRKGMHVRGEWFRLDEDQVKWIIDDMWMDGLVLS